MQGISPIPQIENNIPTSNIVVQSTSTPISTQVTLIEADTSTTIPKTENQGTLNKILKYIRTNFMLIKP